MSAVLAGSVLTIKSQDSEAVCCRNAPNPALLHRPDPHLAPLRAAGRVQPRLAVAVHRNGIWPSLVLKLEGVMVTPETKQHCRPSACRSRAGRVTRWPRAPRSLDFAQDGRESVEAASRCGAATCITRV